MKVILIGSCRQGKRAAIEDVLRERGITVVCMIPIESLSSAFEDAAVAAGKTTVYVNELNILANEIKYPIVYEMPQSKFISKPKNNFTKR
jgi:hypothetical protein